MTPTLQNFRISLSSPPSPKIVPFSLAQDPATDLRTPYVPQHVSSIIRLAPTTVEILVRNIVDQLNFMMEETICLITNGSEFFEAMRPFLLSYIDNIRRLEDDQTAAKYESGIQHLGDLKHWSDLENTNIEGLIELACIDSRARRAQFLEQAQREEDGKIANFKNSRRSYHQLLEDHQLAEESEHQTRQAIAQTEHSLPQLQARLDAQKVYLALDGQKRAELAHRCNDSYFELMWESDALNDFKSYLATEEARSDAELRE